MFSPTKSSVYLLPTGGHHQVTCRTCRRTDGLVLQQVDGGGLVHDDQGGVCRDRNGRGNRERRAAQSRRAVLVDGDVRRVGAVHVRHHDGVDLEHLAARSGVAHDACGAGGGQRNAAVVAVNGGDVDDVWVCHVCSLQAEDHCECDALALGNARSREGLEGRKRPRAVGCQHLTRSTWTR